MLEATLKPGDLEKPHRHPGYVTYSLDSGKVRIRTPDGGVRDADITPGSVVFTEPTKHWAENIGTTTLRFILIELKPAKESRTFELARQSLVMMNSGAPSKS